MCSCHTMLCHIAHNDTEFLHISPEPSHTLEGQCFALKRGIPVVGAWNSHLQQYFKSLQINKEVKAG